MDVEVEDSNAKKVSPDEEETKGCQIGSEKQPFVDAFQILLFLYLFCTIPDKFYYKIVLKPILHSQQMM